MIRRDPDQGPLPGLAIGVSTAEPLRHRQTKGAATDVLNLKPPRYTALSE